MNNNELWLKYSETKSATIKKQIISNYTSLVHYVIHNYHFTSFDVVDEQDFFQFGIEGLSEAIDRFDPNYGTKFETYAIQRIRGKIIDEIRKLQIKPRVNSYGDTEYIKNVSLSHEVEGAEVYSLNETIPSDVELPDESLQKKEQKEILINAIGALEERDRQLIALYYYENLNYKEIAELLGITVSRVSQVHSRILKELKEKLQGKHVQ
jgi:RNA polymerase sigma factor for flagellar operon FliA